MKTFWNRPGNANLFKLRQIEYYNHIVPIDLPKEVERQVNEMLDMDLIKHSDRVHPVVCGAKKMEVLDSA
ncbi:hypothetical protein TNCV_2819321 [Trichonephila clavipes]|nr:hypothetical protein TNCV_2819321 [Trichonephila clavipes]